MQGSKLGMLKGCHILSKEGRRIELGTFSVKMVP